MDGRTFKLVDVYDLREVDWASGEKIPLGEGEGNECHRCRRLHAKVYVVNDGIRDFLVGSGCCKRAFEGWSPSKDELKGARKRERERRDAVRAAKIEALALEAFAKIREFPFEPMTFIDCERSVTSLRQRWGNRAKTTVVWIHLPALAGIQDVSPRDMEERFRTYRSFWPNDRLKEAGVESYEVRRRACDLWHAANPEKETRR